MWLYRVGVHNIFSEPVTDDINNYVRDDQSLPATLYSRLNFRNIEKTASQDLTMNLDFIQYRRAST